MGQEDFRVWLVDASKVGRGQHVQDGREDRRRNCKAYELRTHDLTILIPRDLYLYLANDWRGALVG